MSDSDECASRLLDLKREIVSTTTQERMTASWNGILGELATRTAEIAQAGTNYIPQVNFADLEKLTPEQIDEIKHKGSVVIRGVVDTKTASDWKTELEEFIKANPDVDGIPENDKQFFYLYWTRPQVQARAHPNVLKASVWLNSLYRVKSEKKIEGVDLSVPLTYADRFRIRHPGGGWSYFPPHVDSGAIERWEDKTFRRCFEDIFTGNWRQHDPYELEHRLDARNSLYGRPGQATVFRTFQGWLAMSETAPTEGTLRVFPDVKLSNAYMILRPFFRPTVPVYTPNIPNPKSWKFRWHRLSSSRIVHRSPTVPVYSPDIFNPKNWKFDISTPDFPGIRRMGVGYTGPHPTPPLHPHLRLEETMTSVPKVNPGDMVFWHCDVVHSVEREHTGAHDSAVMYIAAVPKTPLNSAYVVKQAQAFLAGQNPPDFPNFLEGTTYTGFGVDADVKEPVSRVAMGLPAQVA